jgi:hypothetical protein
MGNLLLYKYVPFSVNSLKLLINGEFWFGIPKNQNDPFEGKFLINKYTKVPSDSMLNFFYRTEEFILKGKSISEKIIEIENDYSIFSEDLYKVLEKRTQECYGITCFSYLPDDILMWSHYANANKGFCIEFDQKALVSSYNKIKWMISFKKVKYHKNLVRADLIIEKNKISFKNEKEIMFQKLKNWKYEKEARLIAIFNKNNSNRNIKFNKEVIKGIIFGERMSLDDKKTIKKIINNDLDYKNVLFYNSVSDLSIQNIKIVLEE